MKTKTLNFTTNKSTFEIAGILREAASKLRAAINAPEMEPYRDIYFQKADISTALSGSNSIFGGPRKWGVQVFVSDTGNSRSIELIAVGDEFSSKLYSGSFGRSFFELHDSINRMDAISKMIEK